MWYTIVFQPRPLDEIGMINLDRREGESLIIEDDANGIRYKVAVLKVEDGQAARLGIEVMGPEVIENDRTLAIENQGQPIQLRLD